MSLKYLMPIGHMVQITDGEMVERFSMFVWHYIQEEVEFHIVAKLIITYV